MNHLRNVKIERCCWITWFIGLIGHLAFAVLVRSNLKQGDSSPPRFRVRLKDWTTAPMRVRLEAPSTEADSTISRYRQDSIRPKSRHDDADIICESILEEADGMTKTAASVTSIHLPKHLALQGLESCTTR